MKRIYSRLFEKGDHHPFIPIVSGLPRSGTSLMMSMLAAGGLDVLTDHLRTADDDNPVGYFELEDVKKLIQGEHSWLSRSNGKAVKVISTLLPYLPDGYHYRIIFMRRAIEEVLASQRKMLINRGENPDKISNAQMAEVFEKNLQQTERWINSQAHASRIEINYKKLIDDPSPLVAEINKFLGGGLDEEKMVGVIDPSLYRQRSSK
jgi:sulfotransferase family protein